MHQYNQHISGLCALLWSVLSVIFSPSAMAADPAYNMLLHGALVAEPCVIAPGDETILLNFGGVLNNDLYMNTRTPNKPFILHLIECDSALAMTVQMRFDGTESNRLPGLLALDGGSLANGIAIGLETINGTAWPINRAGPDYLVSDGSTQVQVNAYIQGEASALANRSITPGDFTASATFTLAYD
jgi:type 1 fimbria pilin